MGMFIFALIINVVAVCTSVCILIDCKNKKFEFQNTEVLPKLAKRFSIIPLIINLIILILFFGIVDDELTMFILWGAVFAIFLCMISVAIGPASSLLGIGFSAVFTKKYDSKKGIAYIICSSLSLLISLWIIVMYFQTLVL